MSYIPRLLEIVRVKSDPHDWEVVQLTKLGNTRVAIVLHRHDGKRNHSKTVYAGDVQQKGN